MDQVDDKDPAGSGGDIGEACRTTQHCAYHGWCHRCDGRFADLMSEINRVIQSSEAEPKTWGDLYGRVAEVLHGDPRVGVASELAEARATIRRLNHRAQATEARLNIIERAVKDWKIEEDSVFLPLPSLVAIARIIGKNMEPGKLVSYHEKIEKLQSEIDRLETKERQGGEA